MASVGVRGGQSTQKLLHAGRHQKMFDPGHGQGGRGTYFPGCFPGLSICAKSRLQEAGAPRVSRGYRDTDGKLSPAALPTPPPPLPAGPGPPQQACASSCPPQHHPQPRPTPRPQRCCAEDGKGRVTAGRLPCGPQMGPEVPGIPAGPGSQLSPRNAGGAGASSFSFYRAPRSQPNR